MWVFAATLISLLSHCLLAFTFLTPWVPMCLMGVGYSILACALWPMVALVIPENQLGTAYGIMQAVQNLGLAVVPLVAGWIVDATGYIVLEVFFVSSMCGRSLNTLVFKVFLIIVTFILVTLICVVLLYVSDENRGGMLNMNAKERQRHNMQIA